MRRTKIVCTLGPSTDKEEVLRNLMKNGMNVARMNFSHGTHEEQKARLDMIKKLREELNLPVAALLDTKGPEIRTGQLKDGKKVTLKEGQTVLDLGSGGGFDVFQAGEKVKTSGRVIGVDMTPEMLGMYYFMHYFLLDMGDLGFFIKVFGLL